MATILLSAAGAAIGGSIGGSVLGLSMTAVGRFVGASLGRSLDQRLLGQGSDAVETGRIDRYRITGAGEGMPVAQVFGRMRVGAHVIWATEFQERVSESRGGGKGAPRQPAVREYSYSVSVALALCEGEVASVGRIWADGVEIAPRDLAMKVYPGTKDQLDPKIEAVEGVGMVPAYRGTAYVVIEDLDLGRFGNRIPQFSFEVVRPDLGAESVPRKMGGVALIPGSGEYALATQPVFMEYTGDPEKTGAFGLALADAGTGSVAAVANVNSPSEEADFVTSFRQLREEAPGCRAASLVVSWFGDDLRCGQCTIRPKVEQTEFDGRDMKWTVCGVSRSEAWAVPRIDARPVYGGTHSDQSVIQALRHMATEGVDVFYYPFLLMDQLDGNESIHPHDGTVGQPRLPWRGRITLSAAPGTPGSPDGTAAANSEVDAFFGSATAADFSVSDGGVAYHGPDEWSYRRFILHQAALCAAAGDVDAFCIGSEMPGLTRIRGASGFPAVEALIALAADCRALLGPDVRIGYAADWSEYFGYQPQDGSGDVYFHLDPLWADANIDFVGIDNYMPLSDWRDGSDHADAGWGTIYNPDYLSSNIEGGEGYDWYYASAADRAAQIRTPITDGAHGEDWVFRFKDIRNWWQSAHHERIGGVRSATPTAWQPASKPIWFTELGCAAIDKGTNQPNKFLDPKSSESRTPWYSNGLRDELMQHQYLATMFDYWGDEANNPTSPVYGRPMLDISRAFVWAWDARPFPWFPGNEKLWSDGANYRRGHWINGRIGGRTLASVVEEICTGAGLTQIDTSDLFGWVRGFVVPDGGDARRALQPLMLAYGFDAIERDSMLVFRNRSGADVIDVQPEMLALSDELDGDLVEIRAGEADMAGRVRIGFSLADSDHQSAAEDAALPDDRTHAIAATDLPLSLTRAEGRQTAERWLAEARVARDTMRFALPPSQLALGAGDILRLPSKSGPVLARVDRIEVTDRQIVEAVRIEPDVYAPADMADQLPDLRPVSAVAPVASFFLDLPLLSGDEEPHAPYLAVTGKDWPGAVAVYDAPADEDYTLNTVIKARSVIGVTETPLPAARSGLVDRGAPLQVRLASGSFQAISQTAFLSGGNLLAIGDGSSGNWEIFQFRDAQLVSPGTWALSHRLRGQAGSDGLMPEVWPVGSVVVLLDGTPSQIRMASAQRMVERHFRIGAARRPYDDPAYAHSVRTFEGNGLRPYRPAHLRAETGPGLTTIRWVRRTRVDGDGWDGFDVPLGEDAEAYLVRVYSAGALVREVQVGSPEWVYDAGLKDQDGTANGFQISVAQVSARFGPGPSAALTVG